MHCKSLKVRRRPREQAVAQQVAQPVSRSDASSAQERRGARGALQGITSASRDSARSARPPSAYYSLLAISPPEVPFLPLISSTSPLFLMASGPTKIYKPVPASRTAKFSLSSPSSTSCSLTPRLGNGSSKRRNYRYWTRVLPAVRITPRLYYRSSHLLCWYASGT